MTDPEWSGIAAMLITAWPSARWPEETQVLYRVKLDACDVRALSSVVDRLTETSEFLPTIATILGEFRKRHPRKTSLNGSGYTYGTLEYFQHQYGDVQGVVEHGEWKKWRSSRAALQEDNRSGARGPRQICEGL